MNIWHDISPKRITPEDFETLIEIPKGSNCKYELDKDTGILKLDRILYTATHYPQNYGFIPRTYADNRKAQVGTGDRSERIRTYNFPQGRITDHRIGYTAYNLLDFMNGDIDELLTELQLEDQKRKLETLDE